MKPPLKFRLKAALATVAAALMALILLPGCGKPSKPGAGVRPSPPAARGLPAPTPQPGRGPNLAVEYVSVFDNSSPPGNKGRGPFNPDSKSRFQHDAAAATTPNIPAGRSDPQLKLMSVVGSPGHWLAGINNQILAVKEKAPVRVGRQCEGERRGDRLELC